VQCISRTDRCRAANPGPDGKDGHIPDLANVRLLIERRMVRLQAINRAALLGAGGLTGMVKHRRCLDVLGDGL
jgi:hypothetical protein